MKLKRVIAMAAASLASACVPPPAPGGPAAARLSGTLAVPAELGTRFGVQATAGGGEVSGVAALMVLATPEGKLVSFAGQTRIATTVDASGSYSFPQPLPVGQPLMVTALLPENRRLTGFTVTVAGENRVEVSLASTVAAYLLARKARAAGSSLLGYSRERLAEISGRNRELMKSGKLPLPDLTIGADDEVSHAYVASLLAWPPELDRGWTALLGRPLVAAVAVAAFPSNEDARAVAVGPDGGIFWATSRRLYFQPGPGTALEPLAGVAGQIPAEEPLPPDGTPAGVARFSWIRRLAVDPAGNVLLLLPNRRAIGCLCRQAGTYWGVAMTGGAFYRVAGRGDRKGPPPDGGVVEGDGGPAREATFVEAGEMALDAAGNLYVLDDLAMPEARIRRVDRQTGIILSGPEITLGPALTLAARPTPAPTPVPRGDAVEPQQKGPRGLVLREAGGTQEFLFMDTMRDAVGRVRLVPGGPPEVDLLAGGVAGFAGDGGLAANAALDLSRPDAQDEGAALDGARSRYYFFDTGNQRIRVVDLETGSIATVAGGGERGADGEADSLRLGMVGQMAVGPDGDLYFVDRIRNTGMRVTVGDRP